MPLALLSNWKLLLGVGLLLAIGVQTLRLSYAQSQLESKQRTIIQLQGTVTNLQDAIKLQNVAVADYKRKSDQAQKASQEALRKTQVVHAKDDMTVAALLARQPASTPAAACAAADAAILEFAQ